MRVAVAYNLRRGTAAGPAPDLQAEYDTQDTVDALVGALAALGYDVVPVEADLGCMARLAAERPDLVFNVAEGLPGDSREAQVPVLCDLLGIPHTGSRVLTLALCLHKATCKRVLRDCGVPTPDFAVVPPGDRPLAVELPPPLLVKPVHEGSSMGVGPEALVRTAAELERQVRFVHAAYRQPALVERFLPGREFTVGLIGNEDVTVLPVTEINYGAVPPGYPRVYTYQFKKEWDDPRFYRCPAAVSPELLARLQQTALAAYRCTGCLDVARIDLRLDEHGNPHCLDVNPLPGMAPGFSDLPRQADVAGLGYRGLVRAIVDAARLRHGL